ncbi:MAG: hypothetical protein JNM18_10850 [Planctomycetaceae bacterium]|nr:hypothetical protein [Planctomycetaceae bacterium]
MSDSEKHVKTEHVKTEKVEKTEKADKHQEPAHAVVIDLGTRAGKQVDRLRKGRGKLMDEVQECIDELAANGQVAANAQPIIVIVNERSADRMGRMISPAGFMQLATPMMVMPWSDDDEDEDDDD